MFKIDLAKKTTNFNEEKNVITDSLNKKENKDPYDVFIVGAGGAGYTAAIYSARFNLKTIIVGEELGGQMNIDYEVENYPGFRKIVAKDLMVHFKSHAEDLGVEIVMDKVENIEKIEEGLFKITTMFSIYYAHSVILGLGTKRRKLNVKGEDHFVAKGVSYCATCDGAFYKDKTVAVIGGGDSAFASALILLQHAKKVYIIHRRDEFRAKPGLVDELRNNPNVEFVMKANVTEVFGDTKVTKITTDNPEKPEIELDGIFIDVGVIPAISLAKEAGVEVDEGNYIIVNPKQETNISGIYAAGDITTESNKIKQLIVACAEGAIAGESAFQYIRNCKKQDDGCPNPKTISEYHHAIE